MVQKCALESSGMMAVNMGSTLVKEILRSSNEFSALSISCYNSPTDCVISGPRTQLEVLKSHLDVEVHCKNIMVRKSNSMSQNTYSPLVSSWQSLSAITVLP